MKVGLVLSGGVAKGAYQAGFLKALEEQNNVEVIACSCASIGVFGGYCFSAKKTDELVRLWRSIHFDSSADLARNVWFHHFLKDMVNEVVREGDELSIPVYAPISYFPFLHTDYCRLFGEHQKR